MVHVVGECKNRNMNGNLKCSLAMASIYIYMLFVHWFRADFGTHSYSVIICSIEMMGCGIFFVKTSILALFCKADIQLKFKSCISAC